MPCWDMDTKCIHTVKECHNKINITYIDGMQKDKIVYK